MYLTVFISVLYNDCTTTNQTQARHEPAGSKRVGRGVHLGKSKIQVGSESCRLFLDSIHYDYPLPPLLTSTQILFSFAKIG